MRLFEGNIKIEKNMSFSTHLDAKLIPLRYFYQSDEMLNIAMYDIIQDNFAEIRVVKDCNLYNEPIKK